MLHMEKILKILRKIIVVVFVLVLVSLAVYQVYVNMAGVSTVLVTNYTAYEFIPAKGIVLREEMVIAASGEGIVSYLEENGTKVELSGQVAKLYADGEQAAADNRLAKLYKERDVFEQLEEQIVFMMDSEGINKQISERVKSLVGTTRELNMRELSDQKSRTLELINKKQLASKMVDGFSQKLEQINSEISQLEGRITSDAKEVTAPAAGYFVNQADGFESVIDFEDIKSIDLKKLEGLMALQAKPDVSAVGKVITSFKWYTVVSIPKADALTLKEGEEVGLQLSAAGNKHVTAVVEKINHNPDESLPTVVVIGCENMDTDLAAVRKTGVKILTGEYTGLRVDSRAVRFDKWYVTVDLPRKDAVNFVAGMSVDLVINSRADRSQKADIVRVVHDEDEEKPSSVMIRCEDMAEDMEEVKLEKVEILSEDYHNLSVKSEGIHDDYGKKNGVFAKHGEYLQFERIEIMFSGSDFMICEEIPGELYGLRLHDEIVVEGRELYEGKLVK